jgi:diguanylate cyclase (GGDEF)-like protein
MPRHRPGPAVFAAGTGNHPNWNKNIMQAAAALSTRINDRPARNDDQVAPARPLKILVIDDSLAERNFLQRHLGAQGHEVLLAEDGRRGIAMYGHAPDLVLLDMVMPDLDGSEVVRRLRALSDEWVPIIFLSALGHVEAIQTAISSGGDDYLVKPFQTAVLDAKIHSMQRIAGMRARLIEANAKLVSLADLDGLTGIANRRCLEAKLKSEWGRCGRVNQPISVILFDVDHFKKINDTYGHLVGDECLKKVAACAAAAVKRPTDLLARYGGEEFCVVLPNTPPEGALELAEKLRESIARMVVEAPQGDVRLTISLGVNGCKPAPGEKVTALIERADGALYRAKQGGRNRVQAA